MNKAATLLFSEHEVIINATSLVKRADVYIDKDNSRYKKLMRELLDFFRNYADKYHHYKEEHVLFPEMVKKHELLGDGAIKEMLDNHEDFRILLRDIEDSLESGDYKASSKLFHQYAESLLDHIAVEDEEIFQMMDTLFSPDELEKMYYRFEDCDNELGNEEKHTMERHITKITLDSFNKS
ncbi:MAG: hemerythrin domain-containing protein [Bacteroidia bacterium]